MARIRTVKPAFFRNRKLFLAEQETGLPLRVGFAGLWTCADRDGRFRWEPDELKLDCLPYDTVDFEAVMQALLDLRSVEKYEVDGRVYGYIPTWKEHQIINNREAISTLPPPFTRDARVVRASVVASCDTSQQDQSTRHGNSSGEGKGREGKGTPRDVHASAVGLQVAIVREFEGLGRMPPDTSRCHVWVAQGYSPEIILACVRDTLARKPKVTTLNYFDPIIADAHDKCAPHIPEPVQPDWDKAVGAYVSNGLWLRAYGPEPGYAGCRVPTDVLKQHGVDEAA